MIKRIEKIKNYGIFRDFHWNASIPEFSEVNLFYGLNGAGKSTLGTIFNDLKNKEQKYYQGTFKLIDEELGEISSTSLQEVNCNIYVFNSHFIEDNIGEFEDLKGIVYISEKNKEAKTSLDLLQKEKKRIEQKYQNTEKTYNKVKKDLDTIYIKIAKSIKEEFHVIGGLGNKYSNYNKNTFEQALSIHGNFLKEKHDLKEILSQINQLKVQLSDTVKPIINKQLPIFNLEEFLASIRQIEQLLQKKLYKGIEEKIGNEIFLWLEEGYRLHKAKDNICSYCGGIISISRQKELDSLFSDELQSLQSSLNLYKEEITKYSLPELPFIAANFYTQQQADINKVLLEYQEIKILVANLIKDIHSKIDEKLKNPFDSISVDFCVDAKIRNIEDIINKISVLIESANQITNTFIIEQRKIIDSLEKLFVYHNYHQHNISTLLTKLKTATQDTLNTKAELDVNDREIRKLENDLKDVIKAGAEFNILLSKFLGRNELELKYDERTKGYKITRRDSGNSARFLSEGEKTAIAFVYFLTKVHENGNDIANSIIVFDDPISSFDSNHLYNAYSFISTYFSACKQLFILTHNFNFFKLVRKKYCKKAMMYLIESRHIKIEEEYKRSSFIAPLPKSIKQASSEYAYLFEKIYKFHINFDSGKPIEFDDYMQMSNTCRKVVEAFASFKVQNINDLFQKIEKLYKCNQEDGFTLSNEERTECEQIYKFINAFSHESIFEDEGEDIIFGELNIVVGKVLELIKRADKDHYNAMIESIS